jgi:2-polyprenyl-6-methoxyphenol hydroxylase-like FAD-dependent oxidoreductase
VARCRKCSGVRASVCTTVWPINTAVDALIGDAAHVHSPAGGQGMNTSLVDVCVLGRLLADVGFGA